MYLWHGRTFYAKKNDSLKYKGEQESQIPRAQRWSRSHQKQFITRPGSTNKNTLKMYEIKCCLLKLNKTILKLVKLLHSLKTPCYNYATCSLWVHQQAGNSFFRAESTPASSSADKEEPPIFLSFRWPITSQPGLRSAPEPIMRPPPQLPLRRCPVK